MFCSLCGALTLSYCEQERASLESALEMERTKERIKRTEVEKSKTYMCY